MTLKPDRFYIQDIRAARLCASGGRGYFERKGWSWSDFLLHGRLLADLEAAGDELALIVLATARERSK